MPQRPEFELLEPIASLYEASADGSRWTSAIQSCARYFSAECGALFLHDFAQARSSVTTAPHAVAATWGFAETSVQTFAEHYCTVNVWTHNEQHLPEGIGVMSSQLYPDEDLYNTEFGHDWLRPQGLRSSLGGILFREGDQASKFTLLREAGARPISAEELAAWQSVMDHLRRAITLQQRTQGLTLQARASWAALDLLAQGILWIDSTGRVQHLNTAAKALLDRCRSLRVDPNGMLRAEARYDAALQKLVAGALRSALANLPSSARSLRVHSAAGPLDVYVSAVPAESPHAMGRLIGAIVFVSDPRRRPLGLPALLRSLYGMTEAESRLTAALASGTSLAECAENFGVSLNTVRTQLRTASAKVGVSRQADLIREVLMGPAAAMRGLEEPPARPG